MLNLIGLGTDLTPRGLVISLRSLAQELTPGALCWMPWGGKQGRVPTAYSLFLPYFFFMPRRQSFQRSGCNNQSISHSLVKPGLHLLADLAGCRAVARSGPVWCPTHAHAALARVTQPKDGLRDVGGWIVSAPGLVHKATEWGCFTIPCCQKTDSVMLVGGLSLHLGRHTRQL